MATQPRGIRTRFRSCVFASVLTFLAVCLAVDGARSGAPADNPQATAGQNVNDLLKNLLTEHEADLSRPVQIAPMTKQGDPDSPGTFTDVNGGIFDSIFNRIGIEAGKTDPADLQKKDGFLEYVDKDNSMVLNPAGTRATFGYFISYFSPELRTIKPEIFVLFSYDKIDDGQGNTVAATELFVFGPYLRMQDGKVDQQGSAQPDLAYGLAVASNGTLLGEVPTNLAQVSNFPDFVKDPEHKGESVKPGVSTAKSGCLVCHSRSEKFPQSTSPFPWVSFAPKAQAPPEPSSSTAPPSDGTPNAQSPAPGAGDQAPGGAGGPAGGNASEDKNSAQQNNGPPKTDSSSGSPNQDQNKSQTAPTQPGGVSMGNAAPATAPPDTTVCSLSSPGAASVQGPAGEVGDITFNCTAATDSPMQNISITSDIPFAAPGEMGLSETGSSEEVFFPGKVTDPKTVTYAPTASKDGADCQGHLTFQEAIQQKGCLLTHLGASDRKQPPVYLTIKFKDVQISSVSTSKGESEPATESVNFSFAAANMQFSPFALSFTAPAGQRDAQDSAASRYAAPAQSAQLANPQAGFVRSATPGQCAQAKNDFDEKMQKALDAGQKLVAAQQSGASTQDIAPLQDNYTKAADAAIAAGDLYEACFKAPAPLSAPDKTTAGAQADSAQGTTGSATAQAEVGAQATSTPYQRYVAEFFTDNRPFSSWTLRGWSFDSGNRLSSSWTPPLGWSFDGETPFSASQGKDGKINVYFPSVPGATTEVPKTLQDPVRILINDFTFRCLHSQPDNGTLEFHSGEPPADLSPNISPSGGPSFFAFSEPFSPSPSQVRVAGLSGAVSPLQVRLETFVDASVPETLSPPGELLYNIYLGGNTPDSVGSSTQLYLTSNQPVLYTIVAHEGECYSFDPVENKLTENSCKTNPPPERNRLLVITPSGRSEGRRTATTIDVFALGPTTPDGRMQFRDIGVLGEPFKATAEPLTDNPKEFIIKLVPDSSLGPTPFESLTIDEPAAQAFLGSTELYAERNGALDLTIGSVNLNEITALLGNGTAKFQPLVIVLPNSPGSSITNTASVAASLPAGAAQPSPTSPSGGPATTTAMTATSGPPTPLRSISHPMQTGGFAAEQIEYQNQDGSITVVTISIPPAGASYSPGYISDRYFPNFSSMAQGGEGHPVVHEVGELPTKLAPSAILSFADSLAEKAAEAGPQTVLATATQATAGGASAVEEPPGLSSENLRNAANASGFGKPGASSAATAGPTAGSNAAAPSPASPAPTPSLTATTTTQSCFGEYAEAGGVWLLYLNNPENRSSANLSGWCLDFSTPTPSVRGLSSATLQQPSAAASLRPLQPDSSVDEAGQSMALLQIAMDHASLTPSPRDQSPPDSRPAMGRRPVGGDAGHFEPASFRTGGGRGAFSVGAPSHPPAAGQAAANAANSIFYSLTANGHSSGDAFDLRVVDPAGQLRDVRAPVGFILEPLKPGSAAPGEGEPEGKALIYHVTAYCVQYAKLPPKPGQLYRLAPPDVQEKYASLRPVMEAGRDMADAGAFHPDGDPAVYARFIQQYADWAFIEHWNQQQFAQVFVQKTQERAAAANVKWTKQLEQAVLGQVPGRWQDISMVLDAAAKSGGASQAQGPGSQQ